MAERKNTKKKNDSGNVHKPIYGYSPEYRQKYSFGNGLTYFDQRMKQLGITGKLNEVLVYKTNSNAEQIDKKIEGSPYVKEPLFYEMDNGNIGIRYLDLEGKPLTYKPEDESEGTINEPGAKRGWRKPFIRWRLRPENIPNDKPDFKYGQPKESEVHVWYPPALLEKCKKNIDSIDTLYLVEGEFKAYAGSLAGLDIIGLPSMNAYKLKEENALHPGILKAVWKLNPKNLVYLLDADALTINWQKWQEDTGGYDLAKRLNIFHAAVKNIREFTKRLECDVYYADQSPALLHPNPDIRKAKGLDDLLGVTDPEEVISDLQRFTGARKFFSYINLSTETPAKIKSYFLLTLDKKMPQRFFTAHRHKLVAASDEPETEFLFGGFRYKYDKGEDKLLTIGHPDGERFIRVSGKYFKIIYVPQSTSQGKKLDPVLMRRIVPWPKSEIQQDYRAFTDFFDNIGKYDSFCNEPCNNENYQQVIHDSYNLYHKLEWTPEKGDHLNIDMYFKHIFGDKLDVGLDYITLLYREPRQKLPIICLYSKERGTGKTKFMELWQEIFSQNMNIIGNDEINDRFNDDYAGKLVIGIDEAIIEKRAVIEKIKSWVTRQNISLSTKNISREPIPFNGHFIFTTNEEAFVQIPKDENRFFVLQVPTFAKEDPELLNKCIHEIPAFLFTLKNRPLVYKKETRLYFNYNVIKTEMLARVIESGRSLAHVTVKRFIAEKLIDFQELELKICLWHLHALMHQEKKLPQWISDQMIEKILREDFELEPVTKPQRYKFPRFIRHEGMEEYAIQYSDEFTDTKNRITRPIGPQRFYILPWHKFLKESDLTDDQITKLNEISKSASEEETPI